MALRAGVRYWRGVKISRMLGQVLAHGCGHGQTQVGVDVDLADSHLGSLSEHLLRNTDGAGHIAAVLVDLGDKFLRHRRSAVQNDGETGQTTAHFLQNVKAELGLGARLELEGAVAGADGNGRWSASTAGSG